MSETATDLLRLALELPAGDRLDLARRLFDSVAGDDLLPDDPEYRAELERRLAAVADGTAELIPWEQARESLRAELDRRRAARRGGA